MKRDGQIAIEFLLLISMAFVIVLTLLVVTFLLSESHSRAKAYEEIDDLGKALQQEFLLAAQMENGYTRKINLPITLNGMDYNVTLGRGGSGNATESYLLLQYESTELFYLLPPVSGNITLGDNILRKNNQTLSVN